MNPLKRLIVGDCPGCHGMVRVPLVTDPNALLRCPHCDLESQVVDVLETSIPSMEIVEASVESQPAEAPPGRAIDLIGKEETSEVSTRKFGERFEVSPILSKGAKRKKKRRRRRSSSRSSDSPQVIGPVTEPDRFESDQTESSAAETAPPNGVVIESGNSGGAVAPAAERSSSRGRSTTARRSSSRKRKSSSNGFGPDSEDQGQGMEIVKILIGALVAMPIAQMMIWWWIGIDPLRLGPPVSRIMPALVPVELRTPDEGDGLFDTEFEKGDEGTGDVPDLPTSDLDPDQVKSLDEWLK